MGGRNFSVKDISIEIMRIAACFFVVFNHSGPKGFMLFTLRPIGGLQYWVYLFVSVFCKFSVPLFFAISGALLIPKQPESFKKLGYRFLRIIVTYLIFSFFYYLVDVFKGNKIFSFIIFFTKMYKDNWNGTYWYINAYLALIITLPMLGALAQKLEDKYFIYTFILCLIFHGLLPVFEYFLFQNSIHINDFFSNNIRWIYINIVEYPLLGYYLNSRIDIKNVNKKQIFIMCFFNTACIIVSCWLTFIRQNSGDGVDQAFHNTFVAFHASTIFLTVKWIVYKYKKFFAKRNIYTLTSSLGGCTFGIYLWHTFFLLKCNTINRLWDFLRDTCRLNHMVAAFLISFLVVLIGYVITWFMKKIPYVKRLI